jgi:hypothetical protein
MCIYYKEREGLHYTSKEHIFPANIGGKLVLSVGYVSDEFNNAISGLEQEFSRTSLVSIARQMEGPGKRGRLSPQHATKSRVHVIENRSDPNLPSLGYVQEARAYEIPHLLMDTKQSFFSFDAKDGQDADSMYEIFRKQCMETDTMRVREILSDKMPKDMVLFGVARGIEEHYNCFFAKHPENGWPLLLESIAEIAEKMTQAPDSRRAVRYQPVAQLSMVFTEDHFRIYGKIAFNCLAYIMGPGFVLDQRFDPIRNWIVNGGDYLSFARLYTEELSPLQRVGLKLPQSIHYVHISKVKDLLLASVFLYEKLGTVLVLARNFTDRFHDTGLFCDWRNRREFGWDEFITEVNKGV